jgi:hypothetical protein
MTFPVAPAKGPRQSTTLMGLKAAASKRPAVPYRPEVPAFAGMTEAVCAC